MLGITLDNSLKFDLHISNMCVKASRPQMHWNEYQIAANFNICPISWIFCDKKNTSKLETLQERALHLVFCDKNSTNNDILKRDNFLSLKPYRIKCLAVVVYKCVQGFNPTHLNRPLVEPLRNYNFWDRCRLNQPKFHTHTYGFWSLQYSRSKL